MHPLHPTMHACMHSHPHVQGLSAFQLLANFQGPPSWLMHIMEDLSVTSELSGWTPNFLVKLGSLPFTWGCKLAMLAVSLPFALWHFRTWWAATSLVARSVLDKTTFWGGEEGGHRGGMLRGLLS